MSTSPPPASSLSPQLYAYLLRHRYSWLLVSLLLLVLGSGFAPPSADPKLFGLLVVQNMVVGVVAFWRARPWTLLGCLLLVLGLELMGLVTGWEAYRGVNGLVYIVFSVLVTGRILRHLLHPGRVDTELLAGAMCGFVLLGMVGTFGFVILDILQPNSFAGVPPGGARELQSLNYFSFVTLLTVGYGDIVPLTVAARKEVLVLGLAGHFYDLFVVGVIVGKYAGRVAQREVAEEARRP